MRKERPNRRTGNMQPCAVCGTSIYRAKWQQATRPNPICSRACKVEYVRRTTVFTSLVGDKHYGWKGGKIRCVCRWCDSAFFVGRNYQSTSRIFCSRTCQGKYYSGENCHLWKGGISNERDSIKSTDAYRDWRLAVFRRDHFMCVVCLKTSRRANPIEAHHLRTFGDHPELAINVDNGCTLCRSCHKQTYKLEPLFESFLRTRILRDFTSDTRVALDIVKIKSDLRSDAKKLAEMTSSALLLCGNNFRISLPPLVASHALTWA